MLERINPIWDNPKMGYLSLAALSETKLVILFQITPPHIRKLLVTRDLLGYFETNVG
jgi:hypothetical protein